MPNLILNRNEFTDISTIGELTLDGVFQCFTLEDACRSHKIEGKTAIPPGEYEVDVTYSTKFRRDLPLLVGVKGFEGIRIHSGNTTDDTEGCILVGKSKAQDWIGDSRVALDELFPKIRERLKLGKLSIAIIGGGRIV